MRIVVVGGRRLIGAKLVAKLREHGHDVEAPAHGRIAPEALLGAGVVVDVSEPSTQNLLEAAREVGVAHHVALSVVGADRLTRSGYFRAKLAQERLIERSSIPYTIVRATQCFELITRFAAAPVLVQPIAADDVALMAARVCVGPPVNGIIEVAGPDRFRLDELVHSGEVIADDYFGARLSEDSLLPGEEAQLAETHFEDWLSP